MVSSTLFTTLLAVSSVSFVSASPVNVKDLLDDIKELIESPVGLGGSTFKISQILNQGYSPSGPTALARAFAKFNSTMSSDLSGALSRLATGGSVAASGGRRIYSLMYHEYRAL